MRLLITLLWCIAALLWLPWALFVLRYLVDVALGAPWDQSMYFQEVFMGIWPRHGWLRAWGLISVWPVCAFCGVLLSVWGWRLYWREQDGILTRPGWLVGLSIAAPLLAPWLMYGDARKRHLAREELLEDAVLDARERLLPR